MQTFGAISFFFNNALTKFVFFFLENYYPNADIRRNLPPLENTHTLSHTNTTHTHTHTQTHTHTHRHTRIHTHNTHTHNTHTHTSHTHRHSARPATPLLLTRRTWASRFSKRTPSARALWVRFFFSSTDTTDVGKKICQFVYTSRFRRRSIPV